MNNEILIKLKELHELIDQDKNISESECLIIGEHSNETNLIGTEDSYLNLINGIIKLILCSKNRIDMYEECFIDDLEFSSFEIKKIISEYSDFWIVDMALQDENKFVETSKDQYQRWAESRG